MLALLDHLLKNAIIRQARASTIAENEAVASRQYARSVYILNVLNAAPNIREAIKENCLASSSLGQRHLAVTIALYNTLSDPDKAEFRSAYKRRGVISVAGPRYISALGAWNANHMPVVPPGHFQP